MSKIEKPILAKAVLISKLIQAGLGYDYEEIDETWIPTGEIRSNGQKKWGLKQKIVHKRHQPANVSILTLTAKLLPDIFKNAKELPLSDATRKQIQKLAGRLGEIPRISPTVLDNDTKRTETEHRVSVESQQDIGERQVLSTDNETVDFGISPNNL